MVFLLGCAAGLMCGVLIGVSICDRKQDRTRVQRHGSSQYASRYMNNPVVRELDEQQKTKDIY